MELVQEDTIKDITNYKIRLIISAYNNLEERLGWMLARLLRPILDAASVRLNNITQLSTVLEKLFEERNHYGEGF